MKTSDIGRVLYGGVSPDFEKLPAGHYSGRGTRQDGTGPSGPFLADTPGRFLRGPEPHAATSLPARGPRNYVRSDERVLDDVCARLSDDGDLDASEIEVRVEEGIVTLSGRVDSREAREWAEDLAYEVAGVDDVLNRLAVAR